MKDVHTEHCCVDHGCKYGHDNCTVTNLIEKQSYLCESCGEYFMEQSLQGPSVRERIEKMYNDAIQINRNEKINTILK